jgi:hypothetical protein
MVMRFTRKRVLLLVAFVLLGGCGCNEPSREAVAAMETFEQLLQSAEDDKCVISPQEKRFAEVRRKYARLYDALISIPGKRERTQVAMRMEKRLLETIIPRPSGFDEYDFFLRSNIMFHALVQAVWETTGDERRIFTFWERRRRKCIAAAERCEREEEQLKKDYRRLLANDYRIGARMARVSMKELTEEELATFKECKERRPKIVERLRGLDFLNGPLGWYRLGVPGTEGAALAGGKLYERYQKLSSKELDELVNQYRYDQGGF